ncbi:MAG TPA: hypothetical protein ENL21_03870 [Caldithrix abyssi]|uniref:DNA binding HTH domain-containing protein n=1 Tax=Caldithrix abyssi TaxID=187145 RepID=A0A7V5H2Z1_CALAY|nr:hypothetical protein [Caldithrix abyssi]
MFAQSPMISVEEILLAMDVDYYQEALYSYHPMSLAEFLDFQERYFIRQTLQRCNGNKQLAAQKLNIDRATLWRKIKKHKLDFGKEDSP